MLLPCFLPLLAPCHQPVLFETLSFGTSIHWVYRIKALSLQDVEMLPFASTIKTNYETLRLLLWCQ
jgi:hypothetical protein